MMAMDDYATDWALRHGTGLRPTEHDTLPAPPPDLPDQSYPLRTALQMVATMSDEDFLRFERAIHTVRR